MNIKNFRIEPGHYRIGDWTVIRGGNNFWQVRDQFDDLVESFRTAKSALQYAMRYTVIPRQ